MKSMIIDIDSYAVQLENRLSLMLLPYPAGIYRVGAEEPIVKKGEQLFYQATKKNSSKFNLFPVNNFTELNGDIYNEQFKVVIPEYITKQKNKLLSQSPTVPVFGRKIIAARVRDFITDISKFDNSSRTINMEKAFHAYIHQDATDFFTFEDEVRDSLVDLIATVTDFTSTGTWDILELTLRGNQMRIVNLGDFRIWEWEQQNGKRDSQKEDSSSNYG